MAVPISSEEHLPKQAFATTMKLPFSGIIGRLLASAIVVVGFYLLWLGFVEGNALKAVPGAILIPAGIYLMVSSRRGEIRRESHRDEDRER